MPLYAVLSKFICLIPKKKITFFFSILQWNGKTLETLFKEFHEENAFLSYASHRYFKREPHDMLVGLKKSGHVKRATKTRPGQTATQFVVIKL